MVQQSQAVFPPEEIEWLGRSFFNRAIDHYVESRDEECQRWAQRALSISDLGEDGGRLHQTLQEKLQTLASKKN